MSKQKNKITNGPYKISKGPFFNLDLNIPAGKYLLGISAKATDKLSNPPKPKFSFKVRGAKVQDYIDGQWRYPRHRRPKSWRDNPASIMRELFIKQGLYPKNSRHRKQWDKVMGDLYLYANGKIDGLILSRSIKA